MTELSLIEARRIALAAQGFDGARGAKTVDRRAAKKLLNVIAPLQIDSVNVLQRTQYLPLFSRLGPYRRDLLDQMAYTHRDLFEFWGHEASFMPPELFPLLRWRMESDSPWWTRWAASKKHLVDGVLKEVRAKGPMAASDLKTGTGRTDPWWGWSDGKRAFEWLFARGRVTTHSRRNFERVYDLTERVLPPEVLKKRVAASAAQKELLLRSARAHGVGTAKDLADYFRINVPIARGLVRELAEDGKLQIVKVEGWRDPAFMLPGTRAPKRVRARTLLSPFDSLVWERARTERLFGFRYRIEIYVPPPKRVHGYYVLPFLMDERIVARADLKSDRANKTLLVQAVFGEPFVDNKAVAAALAENLREMSAWLGLDRVTVNLRGDLAAALKKEITQAAKPKRT